MHKPVKPHPTRSPKPAQLPALDNTQVHNVPADLQAEDRWINWRPEWRPNKETGNWEIGKIPVSPRTLRACNGMTLASGCSYAEAAANLGPHMGLGMILGNGVSGFDFDLKTYPDDAPKKAVNGVLLPAAVADAVQWMMDEGAFAHESVSRKGVHVLFQGTLPGPFAPVVVQPGCPQSWGTPEQLVHVKGEFYPGTRWFTYSGFHLLAPKHLNEEGLPRFRPTKRLQSIADNAYKNMTAPRQAAENEKAEVKGEEPGPQERPEVTLKSGKKAKYLTPAEALAVFPELKDALGTRQFVSSWNAQSPLDTGLKADGSPVPINRSDADAQFCAFVAGVYGDKPDRISDVFVSSGRVRADKPWTKKHGAKTYGELTVAAGIAMWKKRGSKTFPEYKRKAAPRVQHGWDAACRRAVLFEGGVSQMQGMGRSKDALRALIDDGFDCLNDGKFHVEGDYAVLRLGSFSSVAARVGGDETIVAKRMEHLAKVGFWHLTRDSLGRPEVRLALDPHHCEMLVNGVPDGAKVIPVRKTSPTRKPKTEQAPAAERLAPVPQIPRHLNKARWTMLMVQQGERDIAVISADLEQPEKTTRRHLNALYAHGCIERDMTPRITPAEFRTRREAEQFAAHELTLQHRKMRSDRYFRNMRKKNASQEEVAAQAA